MNAQSNIPNIRDKLQSLEREGVFDRASVTDKYVYIV